jgi:UDP-N-acetyl-D-glucosamine dehydrogenase
MSTLEERISSRTARIAVIGIGYVGLPLATALARAGFGVTAIDIDEGKVSAVNAGRSYLLDVSDGDLREHVSAGLIRATSNYDGLRDVDAMFICVPTPYDAQRAPDLSYIVAASEGILPRLRGGQLVVLQSTTYPGTTEEIVLPILERSGLRAGVEFHLAFSPERIDPGNQKWTAYNTPKVVGGVTPACTRVAESLLRAMGAPVHPVSSPKAAEMTKLLENTYRSVNIALVNELALLSERMGIDFWEVVAAAATKPFGYQPFRPGPGVGGHCIPVDPYYLSWKAREYDYYTQFIELAGEVNQAMPYHVVELTAEALSSQGRPIRGAQVLVLGVAFKPDIDDGRNSPAARIIELLLGRGASVRYHDPYIPRFRVGGDVFHRGEVTLGSVALTPEEIAAADCVVIVTGHTGVDYEQIVLHAAAVVDTCNATSGALAREGTAPEAALRKVIRLGTPRWMET